MNCSAEVDAEREEFFTVDMQNPVAVYVMSRLNAEKYLRIMNGFWNDWKAAEMKREKFSSHK